MKLKLLLAILATTIIAAGCAATSGSTVTETKARPGWGGPVFVTEAPLAPEIKHTVIGVVQAEVNAGYSSTTTLHPLLAAEARKIGANAVINVKGGRRVAAFSWAAPYVGGTAVWVEERDKLKSLPGQNH